MTFEYLTMDFPGECDETLVLARSVSGCLLGTVSMRDEEDGCLLARLFVVPHARLRGVGTALIDTCVNAAQRLGRNWIGLYVHDSNFGVGAFYLRNGFSCDGINGDVVLMRRVIVRDPIRSVPSLPNSLRSVSPLRSELERTTP